MIDSPSQDRKRPKERSPNYPGIPLPLAIERAKQLWEKERMATAPVRVILEDWGYSPKSGAGLVTLAALKHFGLLEDDGAGANRTAGLSALALRIIRDSRPDSQDREEAIGQAALTPAIHRELWDRFRGELPSDANLRHYLVMDRGFSDHGADGLIKELRATFEFAKIAPYDMLPTSGDSGVRIERISMAPPTKTPVQDVFSPSARQRVLSLPLSPNSWAVIQVPPRMTEDEWTQMLAILTAMKPGIVSEEPEPQEPQKAD